MSSVTLILTGVLNQSDQPVTVTPLPPPGGTPVPIPVPAGSGIEFALPVAIPLIPPPPPGGTPTPPTPANSMALTVGTAALLLYTDGSGATYMTNAAPGTTAVTLDRDTPPSAITLQIAPDSTPGDISLLGVVPLYNVSLT